MVFYKENELIKIADKRGGKNKSDVDGFYKDSQGREFFIKKPKDEKELFTELFAGLLLKELMNRSLIDEAYFSSLICADLIKFADDSYGLIQPKISFTELYKIIGTGYRSGSDRDPLTEMLAGPSYYPALTQQGQYFGLSISLMFSLLLGDYSVHSGNVVILEPSSPQNINDSLDKEEKDIPSVKQFGRIDWGAAFRYFAHPENNKEILNPYEYQGLLNFKWFTKGYIANYKNVVGLFSAIADKASIFKSRLSKSDNILKDIVNSAFSKIPVDLLSQKTKADLANYLAIPDFAKINFGHADGYKDVAEIFSGVLDWRLNMIARLKKRIPANQEDLSKQSVYQSVIFNSAQIKSTVLTSEANIPFPDQLTSWLSLLNEENPLDLTKLNLNYVVKQFNLYIELLAHQAEIFNLWDHEPHSNINMFARYYKGEAQAMLGHAFVAQYRESTILRRLFSLNLESAATSRFAPFEIPTVEYKKEHPDSFWLSIETALNRGYDVITYLNVLKKIQNLKDQNLNNPELIKEHFLSLKQALEQFAQASMFLNKQLETCSFKLNSDSHLRFESSFFYPMSDKELSLMNGDQLVTICLEELNANKPSSLVGRLIKRDDLWQKIESAYVEGNFSDRVDNPQTKMKSLKQWRQAFLEFQLQKNNFDKAENLDKKQVVFDLLDLGYEDLPEFLQEDEEISKNFNQRKELLSTWQKSNELYLIHEKIFLKAKYKITVFNDLKSAFDALPIRLQESYQVKQQDYQNQVEDEKKLITYLQSLANFRRCATVVESYSAFVTVTNCFKQLPELIKTEYQAEFDSLQANNDHYKKLLENSVIEENESIRKINAIFQGLQTNNYPACQETIYSDPIFWQASRCSEKEALTAEIVHDLLVLKTFYQTKYKPENDKIFGKEYNQSLKEFYKEALNIRLSPLSIPQQVKAITDKAHSLFQPRHSTRRLLADALMIVSILFAGLGIAIMARRYSKNKPIFFSQAITKREDELRKDWLIKNPLEEKKDEACVFTLPTISIQA
ncbi:LepB GTPase-activating domain-containing protein [Legionella gresilensis]|uniref:LepB GTPase-activating domain-containing protein n=1 Tax=Legionella gresilensis TaxID=91823 RepID=UPI001041B0FF|nr:LepB GTPase-activating domain-containing protein [Legionella gresilensis]